MKYRDLASLLMRNNLLIFLPKSEKIVKTELKRPPQSANRSIIVYKRLE